MTILWKLQWFLIGIAVTIGSISWLSHNFDGLGRIPRLIELPGITLTSMLDQIPQFITNTKLWPGIYLTRLEELLDYYECPVNHVYRLEIVNHVPLILLLRGFLPSGEAAHLLKLAYVLSTSGIMV